jgi:predicted lipoprotein with Yx(FWY)xxD motif
MHRHTRRSAGFSAALAATLAVTFGAQAQERPALSVEISKDYGEILIGPDGRPVYTLQTDAPNGGDQLPALLSCKEGCLIDWPLVTVQGEVQLGEGVAAEMAEIVEHEGQQVLAYAGEPLFYFHRDLPEAAPQGQGIFSFGGTWQLIRPDGALVEEDVLRER